MNRLSTFAAVAIALAGCGRPATPGSAEAAVGTIRPVEFRIDRISLPGDGGGDYVLADSETRRLFVTHSSVIHILDLDTFAPIASVTGLRKAHGVALASGKGFASDGGGNAIVVFDPSSGRIRRRIRAGQNPDSILFDRASGMIFVFNGASKDISVVDPVEEAIVKTIPLNDKPELSGADGKGRVYFTMEREHAIGVIDTRTGTLSTKFVLPDCEGPAALAVDANNDRLFSTCGNGAMKVVDAATGKVLAEVPVGEDPDGIVYDPVARRVLVAARDGAWTVVDQLDADRYVLNQVLKIDRYAKTLAFDPKTRRLFSSTADLVWPRKEAGKKQLPEAKPGTFRLMVITEA